jgi:sporulation protein YlmC with PRC-barrel domain
MSRILCVAALGAVGLFSFASDVRAADATAAINRAPDNPSAAQAAEPNSTTHHASAPRDEKSAVRPWRASETLGIRVENPQGETLGKIEDLVFNPANGHIRYGVLSFGGVLGIGEKYFAVPWKHFRTEAKAGRAGSESFVLVVDVDKNKLKTAPGFNSKQWPDFGDPAYGTSVDEFYGDNSTAAHHRTTNAR